VSLAPFKAAIFDWDGTTADTETVFAKFDCALLNNALMRAGIEPSLSIAEVRKLAGNPSEQKLEILAKRFGFDAAGQMQAFQNERAEKRATLFEDYPVPLGKGLEDFLKLLGANNALATNKVSKKLTRDMEAMGVSELFAHIVACDPPFVRKPDPGIILEAAKRLGKKPEECIYIGDNVNDILAAGNAGMPGIGFIIEGFDGQEHRIEAMKEAGAAMIIDDFMALKPYYDPS